MSLSDHILNLLNDNNELTKVFDKYSLSINDDEKELLKELATLFPTFFDKIQDNINEITKDGKIDSHDIPQLILIISKLHNENILLFNDANINLDLVKSIDLVKLIIFIIIDSGLFPFSEIEINAVKTIVNSSIQLLNCVILKTEEINEKKCLDCFDFFCLKFFQI